MKGNCVIAQSGGPTAAINASVCGVVQEALKHECFTGIFGAFNGILGVLQEDLFDLGAENPENIEGLRSTPAAALGSCRYKLKDLETSRADYERILEVFKAHNIRYFFYAGGNDSMDTADKVAQLARDIHYDMLAVGIPKTIDNDLAETDHCPGYGSVAKFVATSAMEAGRDTDALYTHDTTTILEVMGRNAGWIAAAAGLAHRTEADAPHLVYLPEVPFTADKFVADVRDCVKRLNRCFIVVGEGVKGPDGKYLAQAGGSFGTDAFGHSQLGGASDVLRALIEKEVGVKCRTQKLGTNQRSAMHFASATDIEESWQCGQAAVKAAVNGISGKMVTLVRKPGEPYQCETGLADLQKVANGEKKVPREFIHEAGNQPTEAFKDYLRPLVQGEAPIRIAPDGLPQYVRLAMKPLDKKTPKHRTGNR